MKPTRREKKRIIYRIYRIYSLNKTNNSGAHHPFGGRAAGEKVEIEN
jgi:hypothetical protein